MGRCMPLNFWKNKFKKVGIPEKSRGLPSQEAMAWETARTTIWGVCFIVAIGVVGAMGGSGEGVAFGVGRAQGSSDPLARKILGVASALLEESEASYVYGGSRVGERDECLSCSQCLETFQPKPPQRLQKCPICNSCGIDCSHFLALVFEQAGLPYPYLDTSLMLGLDQKSLKERYQLLDLGLQVKAVQPGDFLVYQGHVVMLEKLHKPVVGLPADRGDVIHATGGRAIKEPGQGIQRERFVELTQFRGPLQRILRHQKLQRP